VGLSRDLLVGRTIFEAFPSAKAALMEPLYRAVLAGETSTADLKHRGRTFSRVLGPVRDAHGTVVAGMGFTRDVTEAREAERSLQASERRFRLGFDNAPIGMALVELDGHFSMVNAALCKITGYGHDELLALTFQDITHPDDLDADLDQLARLVLGEIEGYHLQKRYRTAGGDLVWVDLSVTLVWSEHGEPLHFISQIQDVTERKAQETAISEAHSFQQAVLSASPDIIYVLDVRATTAKWHSRSVSDLLGYGPQDLLALGDGALDHIVPVVDRTPFDGAVELARALSDGGTVSARHRVVHADGSLRWLSQRLTPFQRDPHGQVTSLLGVARDVTDAVGLEERLQYAALHDELTGLPNRRLVQDRLSEALQSTGGGHDVAVLFCDLDGFKSVNDAHGHTAGDAVLVEVATRLVTATRTGDTVGRMGGDEFVVLLRVQPGEEPVHLAELVAGRIGAALSAPMVPLGADHALTVSVGIAIPHPGVRSEDLLRDADTAMYQAKTAGKNGFAVFRAELREAALQRSLLERHLRRAVADNTIEVHYQPIVQPATGRVVAVEALLRIPDLSGRHLNALHAVTVAEQTGLIGAIGDRVLRLACEQVALWRQSPEHAELQLAVNLSAREIATSGLHRRVTEVLAKTGLPAAALVLEITETVLLDAADATVADLRRLHADGVGIAIDDFGTGYASLRYLASLPITSIKIDSTFTAGLPHDPVSVTLVRATAGLAEDLGIECVVEGVETREQLQALKLRDGLLAQGYLFSRPRPGSEGLPEVLRPGN